MVDPGQVQSTPEQQQIEDVLRLFDYDHLRGDLREISGHCHDLAHQMARTLPATMETYYGLRELLAAKDCFVRSALPRKG